MSKRSKPSAAAAEGKAWVDWAAWGGVVRGNADARSRWPRAGVPGFKCFLIHSGIDGFAWVDEADLRLALAQLRGTGLPLLAHAEVAGPVNAATEALNAAGADWRKYSTYLASRPDAAEVEAIALLIRLAEEFHNAHPYRASCQRARLCRCWLRRASVACPSPSKPAHNISGLPPKRFPTARRNTNARRRSATQTIAKRCGQALEEGLIDMVTTDHSPCPPAMKRREEGRWDLAWGGIASLGLALPVMWTAMHAAALT